MKQGVFAVCVCLSFLTVHAKAESETEGCVNLVEQYIYREMDGLVGSNAPAVKDRPDYLEVLWENVNTSYPNLELMDKLNCLNAGIKHAKQMKQAI